MDTVLDRLERSIEDNIELENDLGIDAESYGIQELENRFRLFDNIKNEAFRLDNEHELNEEQKKRIDKITEIAYDKANQFNLIAERKHQELFELGKRRIEIGRQIRRLESDIEKDNNIVNVQVKEGYEKPESLAKLQEETQKRLDENKSSLKSLISEKANIIQRMRDLQFGERSKVKDMDESHELNDEENHEIENNNDLDNNFGEAVLETEEPNKEANINQSEDAPGNNGESSKETTSLETEEAKETIEPLPPVNESVDELDEKKDAEKEKSQNFEGQTQGSADQTSDEQNQSSEGEASEEQTQEQEPEEPIELDDEEPQIPNVKSNKPKITWKTILHVAAGIGLGAAVFFTAGPLGVGVMSLAGGLANKFLKQRRNEIARLNSLGISTKINTVVEPRPGIKGLIDRVKNKFRTEEGLRDMSWMINSAIITGTTLTVASTVNNLIQARNAAQTTTPSVEPNVKTNPAPVRTTPEPTPIQPKPEVVQTTAMPNVQQPVSQYDGIRIGEGVGDYNVSVGHISSDRAVMGLDTKPLLSQYVNKDSIFGRFASVNPDGSIGKVINTNGLSIEEFCATNGIDPSKVAVSVMDKAGTDQAWISASELVSGRGGQTL